MSQIWYAAVSYTHLDVYKRQLKMCLSEDASDDRESRLLCRVRDLTEEIRSNRDCISLKTLAVSGHDIMGAGVKPGREVGSHSGLRLGFSSTDSVVTSRPSPLPSIAPPSRTCLLYTSRCV